MHTYKDEAQRQKKACIIVATRSRHFFFFFYGRISPVINEPFCIVREVAMTFWVHFSILYMNSNVQEVNS